MDRPWTDLVYVVVDAPTIGFMLRWFFLGIAIGYWAMIVGGTVALVLS